MNSNIERNSPAEYCRCNLQTAYAKKLPYVSGEGSGRQHDNFVIEIGQDLNELGVSDNGKWAMASYDPEGELHSKLGCRVC
jgi:hypothetical protein